MRTLSRLALAGPVTEAIERFIPDKPILRTGLTAVGLRYALRSMPIALAVIGAGYALRALSHRKQSGDNGESTGASAPRRNPARTKPAPKKPRKIAA